MKHLNVAHHGFAVASIAAIVISTNLAATSFDQATTEIMLKTTSEDKTSDHSTMLQAAVDNIATARKNIEQVFAKFRAEENDAVEAKDVDHVVAQLAENGYLSENSPVVDVVMKQGLDSAFSQLDILAGIATDKMAAAQTNIVVDGTDFYLGYTSPARMAVNDMKMFANDLQVIISATWRDHNKQPSFILYNGEPAAKKVVNA